MPPDKEQLMLLLQQLQLNRLPFYPLILVFASSKLSAEDCVQMKRAPMPPTGAPFNRNFRSILTSAYKLNPSIHDGAIVFEMPSSIDGYRLTAWSMRIVSSAVSKEAEPNHGSAYNSAISLSDSLNVDLCCVISRDRINLFEDGISFLKQ